MPTQKNKDSTDKKPIKSGLGGQINIPNTEPQKSGEQLHASEQPKEHKQRDGKPQIINIGTIPKTDVIEGGKANRIAIKANAISIWSTVIGALLFIATLAVFYQTVRQTNASIISANAAKLSADLQKQSLDSQIAAKSESDIAEAKKLKRDIDFINKQKKVLMPK